jgi:signal transduction histidine kinase
MDDARDSARDDASRDRGSPPAGLPLGTPFAAFAPAAPAESRSITSSLSARLLLLTIAFVMVAEIVFFMPSVARYRANFLNDKLATAHLVLTALDVAAEKTGQIDPLLRDNLLSQGRILGMSVQRPGLKTRTFGPAIPARIPHAYDLRHDMFWDLVVDALKTMVRRDTYAVIVTGFSPSNPAVLVDAVFDERPLRREMWAYAGRIFFLSLFISVISASLVYGAIQWLAVRPLRRLTISMIGFRTAPEDPRSIIQPSARTDEVGIAERTLAAMQQELRTALMQKERLAGVGTAVTKISHDLKNLLATAMLESERLEALPDPEVKRLTAGMVRALDRAVQLSTTTLRFAKEGLPQVRKQTLQVSVLLDDLRSSIQPILKNSIITVDVRTDTTFEGDLDLFHRAFENLLRNADEAGASAINLAAMEDGGYHTIHVSDNGPGLAPKARDNLFVPFAGSTRAGGFGLGLPIARELMRAQGGDIMLLSTSAHGQGQGTCFVVRLPL